MTTPHSQHYDPDSKYDPWPVQEKWWSDYPGNPVSLMYLAPALKYLCRLGRKEGESIAKDLEKCIAYLNKVKSIEEGPAKPKRDSQAVYESLIARKVNDKEAPPGFKAVADKNGCGACQYQDTHGCCLDLHGDKVSCRAEKRFDKQEVIFVEKR